MARTRTQPVEIVDASINDTAIAKADQAGTELAVIQAKQQEAVVALARTLHYEGSTDPAVLENSAKDAIRRIGTAIFELGGYLLLLKEACAHGGFLPALERLGLEPRAAQRYMVIAKRFANASTSTYLEGAGMSKLVELLPLDNEQLEELTEFGQTGELALDDVVRMSVKELRAKVRELRADKDATQDLLDKKNARIDKLEREKKAIAKLPLDEQLLKVQQEAAAIMNDALGAIRGGVRQALATLRATPPEAGDQAVFMAGIVGQLQAELSALRDEFDLPDVSNAADLKLMAEAAEWGAEPAAA